MSFPPKRSFPQPFVVGSPGSVPDDAASKGRFKPPPHAAFEACLYMPLLRLCMRAALASPALGPPTCSAPLPATFSLVAFTEPRSSPSCSLAALLKHMGTQFWAYNRLPAVSILRGLLDIAV